MPADDSKSGFQFEISLSVLNHLGRNLYRNFITVLGEAISNAWDADAKNVWISIDREASSFTIKDDGIGMTSEEFQSKFLKIGYSKRSEGVATTTAGRPFIGAKGIGKLALLSCAKRISVFSKKEDTDYVGGVIDNSELDRAIKEDLTPEKYPLEALDLDRIRTLADDHVRGTIVVFDGIRDPIRNTVEYLKKMVALSFRFSLIDEGFSIHVNGDRISTGNLADLMSATEFVWVTEGCSDDYVSELDSLKNEPVSLASPDGIGGFIASVEKPRNLKIPGTDERATVDLFVNGRLRERNILRHIPSQRIVESYLYGQIHFNSMDRPGHDPFTSSREGVVEDDADFQKLLHYLKTDALPKVFDGWDAMRLRRGQEGDEENPRKTKKERKARDLYAAAREDFQPPPDAPERDTVDGWLTDLRDDAEFNLTSYVDCFLSENLLRKFIDVNNRPMRDSQTKPIKQWRDQEVDRKKKANISFEIRQSPDDVGYLDMEQLAICVEGGKSDDKKHSVWRDAAVYTPLRNVVAHTGLLTVTAKSLLSTTFENIRARVKALVSGEAD